MKFGIALPQGWTMDLVGIKDPVEAYETMTRVARMADESGYDSVWLVDHFHTVPYPSQEVTFECWTSLAALTWNLPWRCGCREYPIGTSMAARRRRVPSGTGPPALSK